MRVQTQIHMIATNRAVAMIGVAEAVAGWVGTIAQRLEDRRSVRPLLGMSEFELKDIGISRADIEREVTKPILWR
jgi:uncharacterized protein YjiS (DUF1127 family)